MKKISVLLATNAPKAYDYSIPESLNLEIGDIVRVPFRNRELIGIAWEESTERFDESKLKEIIQDYPPYRLSNQTIDFIKFFSRYNFVPLGRALKLFIPQDYLVEKKKSIKTYKLDHNSIEAIKKTSARSKVIDLMRGDEIFLSASEISKETNVAYSVVKKLITNGILIEGEYASQKIFKKKLYKGKLDLNSDQFSAAQKIITSIKDKKFERFLIDGVTGSGKTEVYFEAIEEALRLDRQSLVLLPEISLTEGLFERIKIRFGIEPVMWHSDLTKSKRREIWQDVFLGESKLVIGARSSLFLPFKDLGIIVIDEEHDHSYKQQEGVIYHARDMAISLGSYEKVPVVMVSATPSLETVLNVKEDKYKKLHLPDRIGEAKLPAVHSIDMRDEVYIKNQWISERLKTEIKETLGREEQVLIFLNRRGYAPLTLCKKCGYRVECPKCDSYLVEHRFNPKLICHQCGFSLKISQSCPDCHTQDSLIACGPGIERITEEVINTFKGANIATLSSDNGKDTHQILKDMASGLIDILIGTQIISKGHHFPRLTCVGVIDADLGMANGDLRAAEKTYQLLHQVSGRTGREKLPGKSFLQTYFPSHPVIRSLVTSEREGFHEAELNIRKKGNLPPYGKLAAIILSDTDSSKLIKFCNKVKSAIPGSDSVIVLGPAPAPITKVRGRFRYRFLLKADKKTNLQKYIDFWIKNIRKPSSIKLTIDIDPYYFL